MCVIIYLCIKCQTPSFSSASVLVITPDIKEYVHTDVVPSKTNVQ
jgi:hypothetical protein